MWAGIVRWVGIVRVGGDSKGGNGMASEGEDSKGGWG